MKSKLGIFGFILALLNTFLIIYIFFNIGLLVSPLSFIGFLFIPIISLVFSIISLNEIKKKNLEGKGYAIVGLILSILMLLIIPILIVLAIRSFYLLPPGSPI